MRRAGKNRRARAFIGAGGAANCPSVKSVTDSATTAPPPAVAGGGCCAADVVARLTGAAAWQFDPVRRSVHWSAPFAAWVGAAPGPATLEATLALLHEDGRERLELLIQRTLAQGLAFDCVLPLAQPREQAPALRLRGERLVQEGAAIVLVVAAPAGAEAAGRPAPAMPEPQQRRVAQQLALVTAANAIGVWEIDADNGAVSWNAQMLALYGIGAVEAPRQPALWLERHVLPEDHERLLRSTRLPPASDHAWGQLPTRRVEHRIVRGDGQVRWVESQSALVIDDDGRRRLIGTSRDITERKQAEQQLRMALQRLEMATDWTGIGVFLRDPVTGEGYWSAQMYQLLGLPPEASPPPFAAVAARLHADDRAAYLSHWADMEDPGVLVYPETPVRAVAADGSLRWLAIRGQRVVNAAGGEGRVAGVMIDITERMRSEQRAQEIADWLQLASHAGRIGIIERNLDDGASFWNPTAFELFGLPVAPDGPAGDDLLRIVYPDDVPLLREKLQQAVGSDEVVEFEARALLPDAATRWLRVRLWAERRADGRPWRLLATLVDINESREATQRLAVALQRLQLATEAGGIGIWERSLDGGTENWNATMFALFEVDPPTAPALAEIDARIHPADRDGLRAWWQAIRDGAPPQECEARLRLADDSWRYLVLRGQVERDADGRPLRAIGTCIDASANRQAQLARQIAAERLALAQRTAGIGLWEYDPCSDELRIDETMRANIGVGAADAPVTGAAYETLVHPDDRESLRQAYASAFASTAAEWRCDYRLIRPDGALRYIEARFAIERDAGGRPLNLLGTQIDVTHLRQTEQERSALIERLQLASRTVRMGIWERRVPELREDWDAQMYEIYGIEPGREMARPDWLAHVHPDDRAEVERQADRREREFGGGHLSYRIVREDGEVRHVEDHLRIEREPDGRVTRMLGVHVDVSAQRRLQIERDEVLTRLQMATEAVGFGIYDWQPQIGHSKWNDKMYELLGHTRESFADRVWTQAIHPDDRPRMKDVLRHVLDEAGTFAFEYRTLWPDGTVRWIATRGRVQRDAAGRARQVTGVHWDITENRLAESALRAKEMAERASAAKSEFLSRMSHELRTPLNAILGFTQLLEIDPRQPLTPPQQERVDHIKTAGWHLLALINEVLELSRIEAGATRFEHSPVAVLPLVDTCIALMRTDADRRGIALESRAQLPATAWADPLRLKQVLLNLLSNAVKYNRDGGRVTVSVGGDAAQVRITVADTGRGLSASQLDKLYQPFNRLGLESAPIEGTGIGLTITLKLVEQMGGQLEVSSEPGIGSEFTVTLPATPASTEAPAGTGAPQTPAPAGATCGTVLYVEDNEVNRGLMQSLLQERPGLRLLLAADGAQGLALAASEAPDLILLDLRLPDTSGIALLRQLRAQASTARVPCFAVSANALPAEIDEALAAGFDDYLTKPLSMTETLGRIDRALAASDRAPSA